MTLESLYRSEVEKVRRLTNELNKLTFEHLSLIEENIQLIARIEQLEQNDDRTKIVN